MRSEAVYSLPEETLVRQDEAIVSLPKELDDGRPVMVSFIFTSCAAICPMLSHLSPRSSKSSPRVATSCIWYRFLLI